MAVPSALKALNRLSVLAVGVSVSGLCLWLLLTRLSGWSPDLLLHLTQPRHGETVHSQ